jgi:hypothetical protein
VTLGAASAANRRGTTEEQPVAAGPEKQARTFQLLLNLAVVPRGFGIRGIRGIGSLFALHGRRDATGQRAGGT